MPILSPLKKTLVASALIAPLVLGACSSTSEEAADTTTTASSAAVEVSNSEVVSETTANEESAAADSTEAAAGAENSSAVAEDAAIDPAVTAADPLAASQLTFAELAPVEGGQPANEADQTAITELVNGMYEATTLHGFIGYLPANTCNAVIQENGGAAAFDLAGIQDVPLNLIPNFAAANPSIESVEDIQIDGDVASASVTAVSEGQPQTDVQRFRLEDGAWKFCN
ncbi:hypothetical protein [Corynebacterium sp. A21]|uniref:hypothetical protein n=1 Tax=Corynebacterium sp. A21 TaxID=3457318 RepID=UPI003FD38594